MEVKAVTSYALKKYEEKFQGLEEKVNSAGLNVLIIVSDSNMTIED